MKFEHLFLINEIGCDNINIEQMFGIRSKEKIWKQSVNGMELCIS